MNTIKIFALITIRIFLHGLNILLDNAWSGIAFQPHKQVLFQEGSTYLTYKLDLSVFKLFLKIKIKVIIK